MKTKDIIGRGFATFIILSLISVLGCSQNENSLKSVTIRYFPPGMLFPVALDDSGWLEGDDEDIFEIVIRDKNFLYELELNLSELMPRPDQAKWHVDMRMLCSIGFKDGTLHELCLGESWGVKYDGVYMEDNPELLQLIKSVSMDTFSPDDFKYDD